MPTSIRPGAQVNFVPGEICLVVEVTAIGDAGEFYERVRHEVNAWLGSLGYSVQNPLRHLMRNGVEIADPLPWVVLSRPRANDQVLAFYTIEGEGADDVTWTDERVDAVVSLVNYINRDPGSIPAAFILLAATPNWLTPGTPHTVGGPSTLAQVPAVPPPGCAFPFAFDVGVSQWPAIAPSDIESKAKAARANSNVVVAVLDTSPTVGQVAQAAGDSRGNWLMKVVSQSVHIASPIGLAPGYFQHLAGCYVNFRGVPHSQPDPYPVVDHGLFVAGIVRSIAPDADIHLIRVLNDNGVGDLFALTSRLGQLPAQLLSGDKRLVVNLSLMVEEDDAGTTFTIPQPALDRLRARFPGVRTSADVLDLGMILLMAFLEAQNDLLLVVAAAGNDALQYPPGQPPGPRLPARHHSVLSVGAVARGGAASIYSNRADDLPPPDHGVAVFGGDAVAPANLGQAPLTVTPGDAIVGLYTSADPSNGALNTTGWASWAGTSFATPIISGLVAERWFRELATGLPVSLPPAMIDLVRSWAAAVSPVLISPVITVNQ